VDWVSSPLLRAQKSVACAIRHFALRFRGFTFGHQPKNIGPGTSAQEHRPRNIGRQKRALRLVNDARLHMDLGNGAVKLIVGDVGGMG
jgi:hypothetical protein